MTYNATNPRNTDAAPTSPLSSQTVAFSHYNNLSAQLPIDPATGELVSGGASEQARQCLENIKAVVESIDHVMDDVVRLSVFLTDISDLAAVFGEIDDSSVVALEAVGIVQFLVGDLNAVVIHGLVA